MATATGPQRHILQRIIPFVAEAFSLPQALLGPNCELRLNSYFQVFHLEPLFALGESSVHVGVELSGRGHVEVIVQRIFAGQIEILAEAEIDLTGSARLGFDIQAARLNGVAFITLRTQNGDACLESAEWSLIRSADQLRRPQLALVSCTFNRQKEILKTIASVKSSEAFRRGQIDLLIVDNGDNLSLPPELQDSRVKVVGQKNLGGAGGFTRGIIEASKLDLMTHVLLMDDDVEVAAEVIDRLVRWLTVLPESASISGAMLDGYNKTVLYEAGARFQSHTFEVKPEFHQIDLLDSETALSALSKPSGADYGAWWFFAFSRKTLESAGLPLPVLFVATTLNLASD